MSGVPPGVVPAGNPGLARPPLVGGPPGPMPPGGVPGGPLAGGLAAALVARAGGGGASGGAPQPQPQPGPGPAPVPAAPMIPGGAPAAPPGMMLNPAFLQWQQLSQAWHAEKQRREDQFRAACLVLRHDATDGYKIDIEADSTVAADEQAEKQARTEFLQSIMPMLQMLVPQAQQNPGAIPLIHALVMFGVRAFPAARSLEQQFEQAFKTMLQTPPQPPPPKGNTKSPEEIASEAKIAAGDQVVDQQANQIKAQQVQVQQQKNAIDMFEAYTKAQQQGQQQQQEGQLRAAELAQQGQQLQSRQALDQARLSHLISRDSAGLV